jgi:hypothetical protein
MIMEVHSTTNRTTSDAQRQLAAFISKFDPQQQSLIRAVRRILRKRFPTADELVYDNYNFFVVGYSATERASDAVVSMTAGANGIGLCFIHGATLPDPTNILMGSGNQTRFIRLDSAKDLAQPEVESLIAEAIARAKTPLRQSGRGRLVIKSVSKKQRPRK